MKNNRMKKLALTLACLLMFMLALQGCSGGEPTESEETPVESEQPAEAEGTDESDSSADADADTEAPADDIYSKLPDTALSGLSSPEIADRAGIEKAWPKTPKEDGTLSIGWTEMSQANPWFVAVKESAEATAKKYGYDLTFLVADNDVQTQTEQVESFITRGVDVIVIDPCDVQAIVTDIKHCVEAGIPVLCIGSQPDESAPILTTLSDNPYEVGYAAGKYAGSTFAADEAIKMACIPGQLGNTSAESRVDGIVGGIVAARQEAAGVFKSDDDAKLVGFNLWDEAKKNGSSENSELNISILAIGEGGWSEEGGLAAAEPIITAHGAELNIMVADNEFQCFGILKAVESADLKDQIKVGTCADGFNDALKMIAEGDLLMSGSWNGDQQGSHAIEFIKAIFFDSKDPGDLPIGSFFTPLTFTKDNATDYINDDPNSNFFATPEFVFPKSIPELSA